MEELVVQHTYAQGLAWDRSPWRNHGVKRDVTAGAGAFRNSLRFDKPASAVIIRRSDSLRRFDAVRAKARIYLEPAGGGGRRQNVIEGQLSFAVFVNPNRSLQCTFLSPAGNWVGVMSAAGLIGSATWYDVEFAYDGISTMQQFVNGQLTAARYDLAGPVRGAGGNGIYVGHWPEPDHRYTFSGYITNVEVWRWEPRRELQDVISRCCYDPVEMRKRLREFQDQGYDRAYVWKLTEEWRALGAEFLAKTRAGDPQRVAQERALAEQVAIKLTQRDYAGLAALLPAIADYFLAENSPQDFADFAEKAHRWIDTLPLKPEEIEQLARDLCFGNLIDTMRKTAEREGERRRRGGPKYEPRHVSS